MDQHVLQVSRVAQVNSPRSGVNSAVNTNVGGRVPGIATATGNVSTVHYQIMAPDLSNRPFIFKQTQSNPPPPQLITTSNTNQPYIMDNSKPTVNPLQVVQPVQTVAVLTTASGNTTAGQVQASQVFATHNGQVLPVISAGTTAIINTAPVPVSVPVAVTTVNAKTNVKIEKKLQRLEKVQSPRQRKVINVISNQPHPQQQQQQQKQLSAALLQQHQHGQHQRLIKPLVVEKGSDGAQQPRPQNQQQQHQSQSHCTQKMQQIDVSVRTMSTPPLVPSNNALLVSKSMKSYSHSTTRKKDKDDEVSSTPSVLNKVIEQQMQPRSPAVTISQVPRLAVVNNTTALPANTSSNNVQTDEKKQKDATQNRQQQNQQQQTQSQPQKEAIAAVPGISTSANNGQVLILVQQGGKQWMHIKENSIISHELNDMLKMNGVSETKIEKCKTIIREYQSNPNSNLNSSNNDNSNSSTTSMTVSTTNASSVSTSAGDGGTQSKNEQNETPVYQDGKLAVCPYCGISSPTFNQCARCKFKFPPDVKSITIKNAQMTAQLVSRSPHQLIRKCSTDSSGNGNNSPPECPRKKAKMQDRKRSKTKVEEPVCLTISSDEESNEQDNSPVRSGPSKSDDLADDASTNVVDPSSRLQPNINDDCESDVCEEITCRTVRIGSFKAVPSDVIVFSLHGIHISVPSIASLKDHSRDVVRFFIPYTQVVKVLAHYGRGMPVIFIYTTAKMGASIRNTLEMTSKADFYYDPASKIETQKRITLLPEKLSDNFKNKIVSILSSINRNIHEELNSKEANDILVRASPKEVQNILKKTGMPTGIPHIQTIMVYPPPPMKGGIPINTEDYACLGEDQFLNDVIIDFYLKYLTQMMLNEEDQAKTHVLSSFFYKRLTTKPTGNRRSYNPIEDNPDASAAEKRHSRVKSWTKAVNIFTKDFIIIPINENCHWFLAIICFPGLTGPVRFSDNMPTTISAPLTKKKHSSLVDGCSDKELANNVMAGKTSLMIGSTTITAVNALAVPTAPVNTTITLEPEEEDRDEADGEDEDWEDEYSEDDQDCCDDNKDNQQLLQMKEADSQDSECECNNKRIQLEEESLRHQTSSMPSSVPSSKSNSSSKTIAREPIKQPCILIFDSLAGASRAKVVATLRDYLRIEYRVKHGHDRDFSKNVMKGASPKVPQQTNYTDCGLYVLQYVEAFFKDPIPDYHVPIKMLQNWFTADVVSRKRYDIQQLLHQLMAEQDVDIASLNLPDLNLRPFSGLVDYPDTDMEDMDEECEEEEEEEDEETMGPYVCLGDGEEEEMEDEEEEEGDELDGIEEDFFEQGRILSDHCGGDDCDDNELESMSYRVTEIIEGNDCDEGSVGKMPLRFKELTEGPIPKGDLKSYRIPRLSREIKKTQNRHPDIKKMSHHSD